MKTLNLIRTAIVLGLVWAAPRFALAQNSDQTPPTDTTPTDSSTSASTTTTSATTDSTGTTDTEAQSGVIAPGSGADGSTFNFQADLFTGRLPGLVPTKSLILFSLPTATIRLYRNTMRWGIRGDTSDSVSSIFRFTS